MYNFDAIVERKHTDCVKWDDLIKRYGENDIIPMGVADMDFACCDKIVEAVTERAKHPVYGYQSGVEDILLPLVVDRYNKRGYNITRDDIVLATGVVYYLDRIISSFSKEGDGIVLPEPFYTPFEMLINKNNRTVVPCPMKIENERYVLDLQAIEDKMDDSVTMFIFCNPHNPTGRIYDEDELKEVADFCEKHHLLIIDDEIHSDFALDKPFKTILNITPYARENTFVALSSTKTFNLAGLKISFGFIPNKERKEKFLKDSAHTGLNAVNIFGVEAMRTAYRDCQQWEKELVEYLKGNCDYAYNFIKERIPSIKLLKNEGTYLLWLDMRDCGIEYDKLIETLIEKGQIQLNDGDHYGAKFKGYARMNCALPRSLLAEALNRLEKVVNG